MSEQQRNSEASAPGGVASGECDDERRSRSWPDNLEAQAKVIAAILRRLLSGGISRATLSVDDFRPDCVEAGYPEPADLQGLFDDLMSWLRDEGMLRFESAYQGTDGETIFDGCVITGYGIRVLRQKSDVFDGRSPADVIMKHNADGGSVTPYVKYGGLLGGVIGGITKTLSGG
jgi:hypothetical protein